MIMWLFFSLVWDVFLGNLDVMDVFENVYLAPGAQTPVEDNYCWSLGKDGDNMDLTDHGWLRRFVPKLLPQGHNCFSWGSIDWN